MCLLALAIPAYAACPNGFVQVTDTLRNVNGTLFNGKIVATSGPGQTTTIAVTAGQVFACLLPATYVVLEHPKILQLAAKHTWVIAKCPGAVLVDLGNGALNSFPELLSQFNWACGTVTISQIQTQ